MVDSLLAPTSVPLNRVAEPVPLVEAELSETLATFKPVFDTLTKQMRGLTRDLDAFYKALKEKQALIKQADAHLVKIDAVIRQNKEKDNWLPEDTIAFLEKIFGKFMEPGMPWRGPYLAQQLLTTRARLQHYKVNQVDFAAESQLDFQHHLQRYNNTAALFSNLQIFLAELTKTLVQLMR